jgi:mannose/fructose/N-acetylgalactosamine-specific phosphotransferase system component IIB
MPMYTNLNNAHKAIEQAVMNKLGYKFMRYESTFSSINFRHKQIGIQYINNQDESNKPTPPLIHPDKIVNMNKVKDRILTDMLTEENKLNLVKQAEYAATYGMGAYKLQDILLNKTNQKETQMLIPITTETKHFINSADVQSMSKADLLRNLSILENNINNLRKLKTQNRSIKAEIKNQKHMLKKVAAHLNSKY